MPGKSVKAFKNRILASLPTGNNIQHLFKAFITNDLFHTRNPRCDRDDDYSSNSRMIFEVLERMGDNALSAKFEKLLWNAGPLHTGPNTASKNNGVTVVVCYIHMMPIN